MITGTITYQARDLQEFKELMQWAKEQGVPLKSVAGKPDTDKGPNEQAYVKATGKRLRLSEAEQASGMTREEIAALRMQSGNETPVASAPVVEKLPSDDGEDLT